MLNLLKRFRNKFKHEYMNSDFDMDLVYDNGKVRFYGYKNPLQLPYKRTEAALLYSRYAQLSITPERLNEYVNGIIAANNKGDRSMVGALANQLLVTDEHFGERQSLLNLATVYCVLEGEPANKYLSNYQEKKKEIWSADEDCRDFFLHWAYKRTPNFVKTQSDSILKYLKDMEEVSEMLRLMLPDTSKSSLSKETK